MVLEAFLKLTSTEREAVDNFAFAQSLLRKGGDAQRRFALISLDIALEMSLRAFLMKRGFDKARVDDIRKMQDLLQYCEEKGLKLDSNLKSSIYEMHEKRNQIYHGRTVMIPSTLDMEAWSSSVASIIQQISGVDPIEYFKTRDYERVSLLPEDLEYVEKLERRFRTTPPYVRGLTWWSDVQRDAIEAGEKWDLYVHYRPRWPFFIPTLVLAKCNPYDHPVSNEYALTLESKASFLKSEKKVWRVWLAIIASAGFERQVIRRAEDHEGKALGLVLIEPKQGRIYCSGRGQCKKARKWLQLG
jgi:hypothetical protein